MEEMRNAHKGLVRKSEGKIKHLGDLGIDERIILQWILMK
jgi:hypothetical protein